MAIAPINSLWHTFFMKHDGSKNLFWRRWLLPALCIITCLVSDVLSEAAVLANSIDVKNSNTPDDTGNFVLPDSFGFEELLYVKRKPYSSDHYYTDINNNQLIDEAMLSKGEINLGKVWQSVTMESSRGQ